MQDLTVEQLKAKLSLAFFNYTLSLCRRRVGEDKYKEQIKIKVREA